MSLLVEDLSVGRGGRIVLRDISFVAPAGRVLVVMGPNGAGKTTLLGAVAGLLRMARGRVLFAGEALHHLDPRESAVRRAVMAQHFDCPFAYPVEEVVALGRLCHAGTARAAGDGAALGAALAAADLGALARRPITTLSGGERQRVAFAKAVAQLFDRAAAGEPHLLILDEPVASLDPEHQHRLLRQARLMAAGGATVVVTLHDLTLASIYGDDVLVLDRGRVAAAGAIAETLTAELVRRVFRVRVGTAPQGAGATILHAVAQIDEFDCVTKLNAHPPLEGEGRREAAGWGGLRRERRDSGTDPGVSHPTPAFQADPPPPGEGEENIMSFPDTAG